MASKTVESHRAGAEVCHGDAECRKKSVELLGELGLPRNLFPLVDIQEVRIQQTTGFMWLVQKKSTTYTIEKIKRKVSYATEVSAFVGPRSIKKLSGGEDEGAPPMADRLRDVLRRPYHQRTHLQDPHRNLRQLRGLRLRPRMK
ncbi:uncharacterized protein M6B38_295430 [Iris pallida]|uniref:Uncharacterized protein n=1 Tax=Iris pallida TaxID=29817 RepID=A0AAX6HRI4_IRIPA|nr:uncharacterized protein M6B38_295430 [Iris pallida]